MDSITSALSSLASSPATKGALDLAQVGSTGYNLYNQYQNQQYQNKLRSLSTDPAAVSKLAQGYTQPLNAGLTADVNNQAQAYLAQRGLSESPQISQQVESQAIAPWIQQNQQAGYTDALQALNLGGGAINPALQQQNGLAALTKAFSQLPGTSAGVNPAQLPSAQTYASLNSPSVFPPDGGYQSPPAPTNWAGLDPSSLPDLSAFYQPNYSGTGSDSGGSWGEY